jgi:hypothetical protein
MRKRTFVVLFACWGLLSAVGWWLWDGAIDEWVTQNLSGRVDPGLVTSIASASADVLPFVGAGVLMLVGIWFAQTLRRTARPPASRPRRGPASSPRKIYIKPAKTLVHSGARFGVVLLNSKKANGVSGARDEIYFRKLDDRGTLMVQIPRSGQDGLQVRYFVDYRGLKFERVKRALAESRFTLLTRQQGGSFRAWFSPSNSKAGRAGPDSAHLIML